MTQAKSGVGSRMLYVLWEFELEPGAKTPCHTHEHDYLFYVLQGTRLEVFDAADEYLGAFDSPTGATNWCRPTTRACGRRQRTARATAARAPIAKS